ncbi:MAG: hypothetical protein QM728_12010 [Gordonia sp. (in: high G+C Gram-positive bacteria)]|uniref:hypothetical protein n=1 Tax=Gordonia sp. (in: high G+C Gram-positive bacteria) TaxID=84139 RepID=UPI0039E230BC
MQHKRIIGAALAAAGVASGTMAVTAPQAQARIASGHYVFTSFYDNGMQIHRYPVYVRRNRIYLTRERAWRDITPTKRGGSYTVEDLTRFNFWRKGDGYTGVGYNQWLRHLPDQKFVTFKATLTRPGTPIPDTPLYSG